MLITKSTMTHFSRSLQNHTNQDISNMPLQEQFKIVMESDLVHSLENNDILDTILLLIDNSMDAVANKDDVKNIITKAFALKNMMDTNAGEVSDGYHTFNELYHHRAILFANICNSHPDLAWKSMQHDDPEFPMYDGMFIVGIETPEGQATYHYDIDPYWDIFHVKEIERAPKYDGHTPSDAIHRIGLLGGFSL